LPYNIIVGIYTYSTCTHTHTVKSKCYSNIHDNVELMASCFYLGWCLQPRGCGNTCNVRIR